MDDIRLTEDQTAYRRRQARRGVGALDTADEIADQAFVDGHLPVGD